MDNMHLSLLGRRTILSKFTSYWTGLSTNDPEPYHVLTIDLLLLIPRELLKLILDFSDISTIFSLSRTSNKYLNLISSDTNIKTVRLDSVSNGHCDLFKWLVTNVRYDSTSFVEHAVKNGRLEILKYLNGTRNRNSCDYLFHYACRDAAANGHLDVLRYLREHFCLWDEYTYLGAAKGGHLDIIKYLHENKCPSDLDGYALKYAATNGDLVMIKYLHEIRFPWNTRVFQSAAKNGNIEILKYLYKNGCPWNEWAYTGPANKGDIDTIKWLYVKGCPFNEKACAAAADGGHLEVLQWLHENGFPWNKLTYQVTIDNGHLEILGYLHENGCPS